MSQNEHDNGTEQQSAEPDEPKASNEFQQEVQRLIQHRKKTTQKAEKPAESESESNEPSLPPSSKSDKKNNPHQKQQKPPDGLMPPVGLVILLIASSVLLMSLLSTSTGQKIPFNKMMEWIDLGPGENNHITITEGSGSRELTVQYSNLDKLVIGTYDIRGTATRQVLKTAKSSEPQKSVEKFPIVCDRRGFTDDGGKLQERLEQSGFEYRSTGTPGFLETYGIWLIMFACFLGLTFLLLRNMGGSGAMAFGRNRGRLVAQEEIDIKFENVAGVDEAVEELKEIVEFLQTPEKFHALGGRIPRGVLLVGPPGTGKTILAKAVAGEAGVPFYSLSGSDFVELYVGVGAARVRDLFEQAQRRNPCIIFIDELDALGKIRSGGSVGGHDERDQTLNALLVEMDGFSTGAGIIVMGATNRPEILDPALLRPGRFDRQVLVDRPDLVGREAILKVHAKNVKLDESIDLKEIASITSGFVGADLAALVNEAALLAARSGKTAVTMTEFTEGVERVTIGLQKKQRVIRPDEKKRIAVHECGHALVAYFTPNSDPVHKVSIIPRGLAAL